MDKSKLIHKKAQAWGIDLILAVFIFIIGISVLFIYTINTPSEGRENLELLSYDGKVITNTLLSEGYPNDWNIDNVISIGVVDNNKINITKIDRFYNMTRDDFNYSRTKALFNTKYDYYFFLEGINFTLGSITFEGIGKPGVNKDTIESENLAKVTRFTIYEDKPTTAYLYIWKEK